MKDPIVPKWVHPAHLHVNNAKVELIILAWGVLCVVCVEWAPTPPETPKSNVSLVKLALTLLQWEPTHCAPHYVLLENMA